MKDQEFHTNHRNSKHLNEYSCNEDLKLAIGNTDIQSCEKFRSIFYELTRLSCAFEKENFKS